MVERMQCNVQSDAINLTKLNYSATIIVHIYKLTVITFFVTNYKYKFSLMAVERPSNPWGVDHGG